MKLRILIIFIIFIVFLFFSQTRYRFHCFQVFWITLINLLCSFDAHTAAKNRLCEIETGQSNIILDIEESRGNCKYIVSYISLSLKPNNKKCIACAFATIQNLLRRKICFVLFFRLFYFCFKIYYATLKCLIVGFCYCSSVLFTV